MTLHSYEVKVPPFSLWASVLERGVMGIIQICFSPSSMWLFKDFLCYNFLPEILTLVKIILDVDSYSN